MMILHPPDHPNALRRRMLRSIVLALAAPAAIADAAAAADREATWAPPQKFDPGRDAAADVAAAVDLAQRTGRRVIVDVGGEWCTWCHIMDRFFESHPDLMALRERDYVWVKVHYSRDRPNAALLSRWPKIAGYPHLFVLDAHGRLVHSQDTAPPESGRSYSVEAMRAFLTRFAPQMQV